MSGGLRPSCLALLGAGAALALSACATVPASTGERASRLGTAAAQPLRDLNLAREDPAPALAAASRSPYAPPVPADCPTINLEIGVLTAALGPDLDDQAFDTQGPGMAQELVEGAIRDLVGLPYRGVVRRITGADARDRIARKAVLAGYVRRAWLRGLAANLGCPAPAPPAS